MTTIVLGKKVVMLPKLKLPPPPPPPPSSPKDEAEEDDDGFEDCDCGFTHHHEDKCPVGDQCRMYERWRDEDGDAYDGDGWAEECNRCNVVLDEDTGRRWIGRIGALCSRCFAGEEVTEDDDVA